MAVSKKKNPVPSESIFVSQGSKRHHDRTIHGRDGRVGVESFAGRRQDSIPTPLPKKADVYLRIARKNAEMRATYLKTTELYTPEDIQGPSAKWKREGRVFAIQDGEKDLFPAFQFADGEPLPVIKKILEALPEDMSPWETAFWFESGNGWLSGEVPQECLKNENKVIDAAEQLAKPIIG